jgi:hypothetical protein
MIKKGYNMIDNMTSNALQNDVIWSMTSQNLEHDIKDPKSTTSLFHHCLITVWSLLLSQWLVSPVDPLPHSQGIARGENMMNDISKPWKWHKRA